MQFELTTEDLEFRRRARQWLDAHRPRSKAPHGGAPAREFALDWMGTLHRGGWSGISWPAEYGGRGLPLERQILWHEAYVAAGAPSPLDPTFVGLNHAGPTLIAGGTPEQKPFHLTKSLAGE